MLKTRKVLRFVLFGMSVALTLTAALGWYAVEHILPYAGIKPLRVVESMSEVQTHFRLRGEVVSSILIKSRDSIFLESIAIAPRKNNLSKTSPRGTVLILHGIASN